MRSACIHKDPMKFKSVSICSRYYGYDKNWDKLLVLHNYSTTSKRA